MAISCGATLLTLLAADRLGADPGHMWAAALLAMAVGVAVGIRAPLVAVFLVPEMLGDYWMVPVTAVVVLAASVVDRGIDAVATRLGAQLPAGVYDEDA
jgi:H+/Cl- antiporter ClcA